MNLSQSLELEKFRRSNPQPPAPKVVTNKRTADDLAVMMAARTGARTIRDYMASKEFVLAEIRVGDTAVIRGRERIDMFAGKARKVPIVVDVNKNNLGKTPTSAFTPKVIVIDGGIYASSCGCETIMAWVGKDAIKHIPSLNADHQFGADELRTKLSEILREKYSPIGTSNNLNGPYAYIREVYPFENYFVYDYDGDSYRQKFKPNLKKRQVTFVDDPVKVVAKYVDVDAVGSGPAGPSGSSMSQGDVNNTNPSLNAKKKLSAGGPGSGRHAEVLKQAGYVKGKSYNDGPISKGGVGKYTEFTHPSKGTVTVWHSGGTWSHEKGGGGSLGDNSLKTFVSKKGMKAAALGGNPASMSPGSGVGPRVSMAPPAGSDMSNKLQAGGPGSGRRPETNPDHNSPFHAELTKAGYIHTKGAKNNQGDQQHTYERNVSKPGSDRMVVNQTAKGTQTLWRHSSGTGGVSVGSMRRFINKSNDKMSAEQVRVKKIITKDHKHTGDDCVHCNKKAMKACETEPLQKKGMRGGYRFNTGNDDMSGGGPGSGRRPGGGSNKGVKQGVERLHNQLRNKIAGILKSGDAYKSAARYRLLDRAIGRLASAHVQILNNNHDRAHVHLTKADDYINEAMKK